MDRPKWSETRAGVGALTISDTLASVDGPPAPELAPGLRIHKYELIREIGRGGMGIVYVARDTRLGRRVAIKFLRTMARDVAERFLVEARATAQCNHDNIVIIHEADEYLGMPYMVLELLEGQTLRELVTHALPATRALELVVPVARALVRAHELGIIHRDLKPENILVTTAGQVKVLDFGIAKALGAAEHAVGDGAASLQLTSAGALVGTLPYMSPEQLVGGTVDHRADLWACGIMLWELLAGRHPVAPLTSEALFETLASDAPMPAIQTVAPAVAAELADVVDACLRKRPEARLASARELAERLELLVPNRFSRRLDHDSPYPGLSAFQESDADRFFGRSREITRTIARLREAPLLAVVGPSGVCKSSFVRAGLACQTARVGRGVGGRGGAPGAAPAHAALSAIVQRHDVTPDPRRPRAETEAGLDRLRSEPGHLGAVLRRRARERDGHVLLFVDQLEELYTLGAGEEERRAFTSALAGVADDPAGPLRVVVSMRSDLLDRVAEDTRFMDEVTRGLVLLAAPHAEALREALVAPAELSGYHFESAAMAGEMVEALAGTAGALPLLQFTAAKLWETRDRATRTLTLASYRALGGISGALAGHADEVVGGMNAQARQLAREVLRALVTPERTRALVELADLEPIGGDRDAVARVIDQLVAARLLVVQTHAEGGRTVELVHESLIDRWPRLRRWLDEDHDDAAFAAQLAAAAKQWDARGRPAGLLWRGDAMEEARRWVARQRTVPAREQAFLDAVLALAHAAAGIRRAAVGGAFAVLVAIAAGASVAYFAVREAKHDAGPSWTSAPPPTPRATVRCPSASVPSRTGAGPRSRGPPPTPRARPRRARSARRTASSPARTPTSRSSSTRSRARRPAPSAPPPTPAAPPTRPTTPAASSPRPSPPRRSASSSSRPRSASCRRS
ncbi:MAG: serine/threonine protein kinase [Deltaproteobacteria bacterium]|nr:serine/threonine protein kinase [Deltaproteobacteria bacterium]